MLKGKQLTEIDVSTVDVLKLDIEELRAFSGECDSWLSHVRTIAMEIHSRLGPDAVVAATRRHHFSHKVYPNLQFFCRYD